MRKFDYSDALLCRFSNRPFPEARPGADERVFKSQRLADIGKRINALVAELAKLEIQREFEYEQRCGHK